MARRSFFPGRRLFKAFPDFVSATIYALAALLTSGAAAQDLLWSEEFDGPNINSSTWSFATGNDGWGNGELQDYTNRPENARIDNGQLVITARRENSNGSQFTSARLSTQGRYSFLYADIEARVRIPDLKEGLWPAFWLLGDNFPQVGWPSCGEIDIFEMGSESARIDNVTNRRMSSTAHWSFQGNHAQYGEPYTSPTDLNNDFHTLRMSWTPSQISTTIDGIPVWTIDISNPQASSLEEFHLPHFLIANLAVGGFNYVNLTNPAQITAPFPAEFRIDWIRVYDNGHTEVIDQLGPAETGNFGIFTDTTNVTDQLTLGTDAELYLWNNMNAVATTPFEGSEVWSLNVGANDWFGMGVFLQAPRNMENYGEGYLIFHMKTTTSHPLRIGLLSTNSSERWVTLSPSGEQYGLVRDGEWHEVIIPVSEFNGVDLADMSQMFMVSGDAPPSSFNVSFDNVYWAQQLPGTGPQYDGWMVIGPGDAPTPSPSATATPTPAPTPTPTVAPTATPSATPTPVATSTPSATPTATPNPSPTSPGRINIALSKPATASSIENGGFPAGNAVDGDNGTRWSSLFTDPQWIEVDLLNVYDIEEVVLNWEDAYGSAYSVEVSTDGSNWSPIYTTSSGDGGVDALTVSATGRYLRMYGTARATPYGYSLFEFEAYGALNTDPTPTPSPSPTPSPTPTPSLTPTPSPTPSPTPAPGECAPLYGPWTTQERPLQYETEDALITRFSDRGRDRHAKENHFSSYEHYLSFYWEDRTISVEIVDYVAKGGSGIEMRVQTLHHLNLTESENRWFYIGQNTLAEFCDNSIMTEIDPFNYVKFNDYNCLTGQPIALGDEIEFEISQFLDDDDSGDPDYDLLGRGRSAYYGTTFLYVVGKGLVPWDTEGEQSVLFSTRPPNDRRDSFELPESTWLGGEGTLHAEVSHEPDNHYLQMMTNINYGNAQKFMLGRRLIHTSFVDGDHVDESPDNEDFFEMAGLAGPHYTNESCISCHTRNGGAAVDDIDVPLTKWLFRVGDENGDPLPGVGSILQPLTTDGATSEGWVSIKEYTVENGLRKPVFEFSNGTPAKFSARIAPRLVGMGLLEAIPEEAILAGESDTGEITGRANRIIDPETGFCRIGRFGWKAGTFSVRHQIATALNGDMGVMTSMLPHSDCGSEQGDCEPSGAELADEHLDNLVKYISLLGVRPQRNWDDPDVIAGDALFNTIGCADCHTPSFQTSEWHPFSELSDQTIWPYSDLLLHDMGPGLADSLGEGDASGSEWRTTPLWGIGNSADVTGGVAGSPPTNAGFGLDSSEYATPVHTYLHDGRAQSLEEAILWHGGEAQSSKEAFEALTETGKQQVIRFLESL